MKPVNLLPEEFRPRRPSGEAASSSRVVIGALAVLLLMAIVYALSSNQVNSRKGDIASAKSEIERAQVQSSSQSAFGTFHDMKETRVTSVKTLAGGRFDWERLMREVSLLLPNGTWVLDMNASTSQGTNATPGSSGSSAPAPTGSSSSPPSSSAASPPAASGAASGSGAPVNPTLHLVGCALHQPDVAVLLVRLRKLHDATDVDLTESAQEEDTGAGGAPSSSDSAGSEGCGAKRFKFDVTVTFSAPQPAELDDGGRVPASLGGGS